MGVMVWNGLASSTPGFSFGLEEPPILDGCRVRLRQKRDNLVVSFLFFQIFNFLSFLTYLLPQLFLTPPPPSLLGNIYFILGTFLFIRTQGFLLPRFASYLLTFHFLFSSALNLLFTHCILQL